MAPARGTIVVRPEHLRVLSSPIRQEVLDTLAGLGAVSLAELGAILGRPADGLYYHVRLLERAGLVRFAGTRRKRGRAETLVRATAPQFALRYAAAPPSRTRALNAIVGSM